MGWTHYRAKVAALTRDREPDDPELVEARRMLAIAFVEHRITKAVEDAGPLPEDVVDRITRVVRAAGDREAIPA